MKQLLKQYLATIFVLVILISPLAVLMVPRHTIAVFGVGDAVVEVGANLAANVESAAANTVTAANETIKSFKDLTLDTIAWSLANILIEHMAASIVDWINGGFDGNPAFVSDVGGFLTGIADKEIGDFIYNSKDLAFLCSPFQLDIRTALSLKYQPFQRKVECTLTDVVDNIDGFVNGGVFSDGGWDGWFQIATDPKNNPYGEILAATGELNYRIANSQSENLAKLNFGKGFLSFEKCTSRTSGAASGSFRGAQDSGVQDCEITTPGAVIEEQLNNSLASGQRRLEVADEFNEIISALISQLVSQALGGGGSGGLRGLSSPSVNGGPSYTQRLRTDTSENGQINKGIGNVVSTEQDYRNQKALTLSRVQGTKALLESNAYADCGFAQNQLQNVVIPLEKTLSAQVDESDSIIQTLLNTQSLISNAQTSEESQQAVIQFSSIKTHNQVDTLNAQSAHDDIVEQMQNIEQSANRACDVNSSDRDRGGGR